MGAGVPPDATVEEDGAGAEDATVSEAGDNEDDGANAAAESNGTIVDNDDDEWAWLDQVSERKEVATSATRGLLPDFDGVPIRFLVEAVFAVSSAAASTPSPVPSSTAASKRRRPKTTSAPTNSSPSFTRASHMR